MRNDKKVIEENDIQFLYRNVGILIVIVMIFFLYLIYDNAKLDGKIVALHRNIEALDENINADEAEMEMQTIEIRRHEEMVYIDKEGFIALVICMFMLLCYEIGFNEQKIQSSQAKTLLSEQSQYSKDCELLPLALQLGCNMAHK